jgi:hypothetical protein
MKVALVCIAKDEYCIEEWCAYHYKLGFDKVFIYENDWNSGVDFSYVTTIKVQGRAMQVISYCEFVKHYKQEYDWAMFLDCDEYLVLKKHNNVKDFITAYDNPNGISVNWIFFGSNSNPLTKSLIKRFTMRAVNPDKHIKTILNLKHGNTMVSPHHPIRGVLNTKGRSFECPFDEDKYIDIAQINHYFYRSHPEWETKCKRGDANFPRYHHNDNEWINHFGHDCVVEDLLAYNFMYGGT